VSIQFHRTAAGRLVAQHSISCGPVNHLEPGYMVQLTNLFVNRNRSGIDAHQRLTGATSNNQVDLSSTSAKENSMPAEPVPVTTNNAYVSGGALAGQIVHDSKAVATILAATTPTTINGDPKIMKPTEMLIYDQNCNPQYAIFMVSGTYKKP
jgi:hypothetical protein